MYYVHMVIDVLPNLFKGYVSMYQILGFQHQNLTFKDGRSVSGYKFHLYQKRDGVTGYAADSVFISDAKCDGYIPALDDQIDIIWNRWGKCEGIRKINSAGK